MGVEEGRRKKVGRKGGPEGVNQTGPLLTNGGKQAILGVQVLQKIELENLENIDRLSLS